MRKLLLILPIAFIISCESEEYKKQRQSIESYEYQITLKMEIDSWNSSYMYCDSFSMINKNEIYVYCKGVKQKIYADGINVNQNPFK